MGQKSGRKRYASASAQEIFPFLRDNQKVDFFPFNRIQNVWNFIAPMAIRNEILIFSRYSASISAFIH